MFKNLMKKAETIIVSKNKIIEEIHETFFTEVDKLLAEAKISKSTETQYEDLLKKQERLRNLGFKQTKEMIVAQKEIERLAEINRENNNKKQLIRAIEYFSMKYPTYKFITEDSVKKICMKYGLIYGGITRYKGMVPDRAIEEMEKFKINEEDELWLDAERDWRGRNTPKNISFNTANQKRIDYEKEMIIFNRDCHLSSGIHRNYPTLNTAKSSLEIAAPMSDFDTTNMEVKDFQLCRIQVPDPIVLQPVMYENIKYYLIVTAWGLEAQDELVYNPKLN